MRGFHECTQARAMSCSGLRGRVMRVRGYDVGYTRASRAAFALVVVLGIVACATTPDVTADEADEPASSVVEAGAASGRDADGVAADAAFDAARPLEDGATANDADAEPLSDAGPVEEAGLSGTHDDGLLNAGETDVDCGGTTGAPPCALAKACLAHADCASTVCRHDGICIDIAKRSCAGHAGGDTCGPNGDADCCAALPVPRPEGALLLDTYSITAGRFRQFVERTNGDLRGWIQANRPADWEASWDAWLPAVVDDGTARGRDGVYQQLGPGLYYPATGGNMGCEVDKIGARTYWIPNAVNEARFVDHQYYDQATLDAKPLVCATWFMFAAFCAWDGGRLPTLAELDFAWTAGDPDSHYFPWGNTPRPLGWADQYPFDPTGQGFGTPFCNPHGTGPCDKNVASWRYNSWTPPLMVATDYAVYIPPPGRYPMGNGPYGHADLGGLVFNLTADLLGDPGDDPQTRLAPLSRGGSWQGHEVPYYAYGLKLGWRATSKYWATGARCAR